MIVYLAVYSGLRNRIRHFIFQILVYMHGLKEKGARCLMLIMITRCSDVQICCIEIYFGMHVADALFCTFFVAGSC